MLAGLNSARESKSTSGLPGLSRIPILGALFGSRNRLSEQTKNLLFIVPSVVQAVPMGERNLVEEMLRVYQEFKGDLKDVRLLEPPPRTPSGARQSGSTIMKHADHGKGRAALCWAVIFGWSLAIWGCGSHSLGSGHQGVPREFESPGGAELYAMGMHFLEGADLIRAEQYSRQCDAHGVR